MTETAAEGCQLTDREREWHSWHSSEKVSDKVFDIYALLDECQRCQVPLRPWV
jgi:hypothetical protein